jgi:hypothetical protein
MTPATCSVKTGDIILYNTLAVTFNAGAQITASVYFLIERVLSRNFVLYCRTRCLREGWGSLNAAFLMFREAEIDGRYLLFNMTVNPSMILKNVTDMNRREVAAKHIQRSWRRSQMRPER